MKQGVKPVSIFFRKVENIIQIEIFFLFFRV